MLYSLSVVKQDRSSYLQVRPTGKIEASDTGIQHIKRTARGSRSPAHYILFILIKSAVRTAARHSSDNPLHSLNREERVRRAWHVRIPSSGL